MNFCILMILVLSIILIFVLIKLYLIKKSLTEISSSFKKILKDDTNNLLSVSCKDKDVLELADSLNDDLKELRKQKLLYSNGNNELKNTITNISHDIRTPLTAISGYVELLEEEKLFDKQRKYIDIINNKTNELVTLTDQLYDFSKCVDSIENVSKEKCCLNNVLADTLAEYYKMFQEKNIVPEISICEKKIYKYMNKHMLVRIFENLISNILRYSDSDCKIELNEDGKMIFSNKASKMNVTIVKKIFDRYYTIEDAEKNSGVGLSIVKQLVELNNGKIISRYKNDRLIIEMILI